MIILFGLLATTSIQHAKAQTALPVVSIVALDATIYENAGSPARFLISRNGPTNQPLVVSYSSIGTAINGIDFQRLSGRVTIPAGTNAVVLAAQPIDDVIPELPETIQLQLTKSTDPFSLAILPDTQYYTARKNGGTVEMFAKQTEWIVNKRDEWNIAFTLHEGDCTDENSFAEWQNVKSCMDTLRGVVPYAIAVGNHDGIEFGRHETGLFNQHFPITDPATASSLGGVFESGRLDNCFHLFSAGGVDWLVLSLEFGVRDAALTWANSVVTNHPNRKVIILTHAHLAADNTLLTVANPRHEAPKRYGCQNDGVDVWDKLVRRHANIAFVFNGHIGNGGLAQLVGIGDNGNKVYQLACNYQFNAYGGGGYMRVLQFFPGQDKFVAKSFSPYFGLSYNDHHNEFTYTNLGIFSNIVASYDIDGQLGQAVTALLSDDPDTNGVGMVQVSASGFPPEIRVRFNKLVEEASATNIANYSLSDGRALLGARLLSDGQTVLLAAESNLNPIDSYVITATGVNGVIPSGISNAPAVSMPFAFRPIYIAPDFSDGTLGDWVVIDEGNNDGPSQWRVWSGGLAQFSNIYGPGAGSLSGRRGTFAYYNHPAAFNWSNYVVSVTLRSNDDDGIGLMFNYQNPQNYYKFDMDLQRNFRKLFRVLNGVETTLASESAGYVMNTNIALRVEVTPGNITITMNGETLFGGSVYSVSPSRGTVALYSWGNTGSLFTDIVIAPRTNNLMLPQINLLSPTNNATFASSSPLLLTASVFAPDTGVSAVEYFVGNNFVGRRFMAPFQATIIGLNGGTYRVDARVTDWSGRQSWATPTFVTVSSGSSLAVGPSLLRLRKDEQGRMRLEFNVEPSSAVALQVSSNLVAWQPLGSVTNLDILLQDLDPASTNAAIRFYRAIPVAP